MQFTTEVDNKPTQIAGNLGRTTHNGRNGALGRLFFGSTPSQQGKVKVSIQKPSLRGHHRVFVPQRGQSLEMRILAIEWILTFLVHLQVGRSVK